MNDGFAGKLQERRQEQRTEAVKQRDAMLALTATDGWKMLAAFVENQVKARQGKVFCDAECSNLDYLRGEVGMAMLISKFPETVVQASEQVISALNQEQADATTSRQAERAGSTDEDTSGWTAEDDC